MTKKRLLLLGLGITLAVSLAAGFYLARPTPPPAEVVRGDLEIHEGRLCLHGTKQPYSGELVEKYPKGTLKARLDLRQGKVDGLSCGWYEDGRMEVRESFVAGVSHGLRTRWHPNGQKRSEEQIEHGVVVGRYVEWHDNGQKALEMTLKDGKPDGLVRACYRDGALKSLTQFSAGKMTGRKFFPDAPGNAKPAEEVAGL